MSIGWFANIADAELYFTTDRLRTTAWDDLPDNATKTKAVINAYNRIFYNPRYNVPTYAAATAAQLVVLKKVNGEMAYFLAQHLNDEDSRMGLRMQGVIKAGIAKEDYKENEIESAVPPFIDELLDAEGFTTEKTFGLIDIDRDEDESVDEDVTD